MGFYTDERRPTRPLVSVPHVMAGKKHAANDQKQTDYRSLESGAVKSLMQVLSIDLNVRLSELGLDQLPRLIHVYA
jgi:hypothetical protein